MRTRSIIRGGLLSIAVLATGIAIARPAGAQSTDRGWLGVYTQSLTDDLRDEFNVRGDGVLVTRVTRGGPADRAGIRRGDVVVSIGGREVSDAGDLTERVRSYRSGQYATIRVLRDGQSRTFNVRLGSRDDVRDEDADETPVPRAPGAPGAPEAPELPDLRWHGLEDMPGLQRRLRDLDLDHDGDVIINALNRGRLGVRVETLEGDLAGYFQGADKGALVLGVTGDSPAGKAGIRAGDVITRVDDTTVEDVDDLIRAVRAAEGTTQIALVRHGSPRTIEADLGRRSEPQVMRLRTAPRGRVRVYRDDDTVTPPFEMRFDDDPLRKELEDLKRELRDLKRELDQRR